MGKRKYRQSPLGSIKSGLHLAKVPDEANLSNRVEIKKSAKKTLTGKVIMETYPGMSWKDFDHDKFLHLKAAFLQFLNSKTTPELYTLLELDNLLKFAKTTWMARMQRTIAAGQEPDDYDMERMDKLIGHLMNLHKLKHGDKHIIAKINISDIRDLSKEENDNSGN